MSTYREIHGKAVKTVTTNPTDDAAAGQIWFNSTDNNFKSVVIAEAWSSSANRVFSSTPAGQGGTQNAAWVCGENDPPGTNMEEYNGAGWSAGGAMSTARRYGQGWGTQTACITASGSPLSPPNVGMTTVEEYNGSAWTSGTAVPAPAKRYNGAGLGAVKTSGLIFCGDQNPPPLNTTFEWDDSSWTAGGAYPFSGPIGTGSGGGTQTAGIAMGGNSSNTVCKYNGTAWTTTTNFPASKNSVGVAGSQTAAIGFGGSPATTNAFLFDGSTFTATGSLGTSNSGAYGMGGSSPSTTTVGIFASNDATEEFNSSINTITAAAWSSAATANTARGTAGGTGPSTSALVFGGQEPSRSTATEEYNGVSWSTGGALPTATTGIGPARNASQTAALGAGGYVGSKTGASYTYDGSSWSGTPPLGTPRQLYMVGGGTSTSAIVFGGDTWPPAPGRNSTATEEWNGSTWTAGGSLGSGGYSGAGTGLQTAAVRMGAPSTGNNTVTENYNGTAWTSSATIPMAKSAHSASGTQTAALMFGGSPSPLSQSTLSYDGSVYSTAPSTVVSKYNAGGGGTSSASFMSHGRTPPGTFVATTEVFTAETTALNVKTLTQS